MVYGTDQRVGHQFWYDPEVSRAVVSGGASFAVVTGQSIDLPAELKDLDVQVVVAPNAVGDAYAIVVRPDRYVATVASNENELREFATTVLSDVR